MRVRNHFNIILRMKLIILLLIYIISFSSCSGQSEAISQIIELSEKIKFIDLHEFNYNRINRYNTRNPNSSIKDFIEISTSLKSKEINQLLISKEPKLRALGVLCLYQSDQQDQILRIANYLQDTIECFKPNPYPKFGGDFTFGNEQPSLEDRLDKVDYLKVSDVAYSIISHYFKQSGHVYFEKEIDQFVKERRNLRYSAGFLKLLKLKATGGISPFQQNRIEYVNILRKRVNEIDNKIDRSIYKLYLSSDEYQLYRDEELKIEMEKLGKENIKLILQRKPPTKDPDILNVQNSELYNWEYNRMCKWILQNAKQIFHKEDSKFLIQQEKIDRLETRTWRTTLFFPYWHIAAARIDPDNAEIYISECLKIFDGKHRQFERGELYAELLHLTGKKNFEFVKDWIFDSYTLDGKNNERFDNFINNLNKESDLKFLSSLIQDPRFENRMNVWDIIQVAWQINKLSNDELISDHLTREIWHPFGLSRVESSMSKAKEKYPDETKEMMKKTMRLVSELRKIE